MYALYILTFVCTMSQNSSANCPAKIEQVGIFNNLSSCLAAQKNLTQGDNDERKFICNEVGTKQ